LIQPLLDQRPTTLFVDVKAVSGAGRLSMDEHTEGYGRASRTRSHDEMDVTRPQRSGAGVEPTERGAAHAAPFLKICDLSACWVRKRGFGSASVPLGATIR